MRNATLCTFLIAALLTACNGSPTAPAETIQGTEAMLATGRWSGGSNCLSVDASGCELVVGCMYGRFSRPVVHADGTFVVDGTYRFEGGPSSDATPPAARFTGTVSGESLTLIIQQGSAAPVTLSFAQGGAGNCPRLCV